METCQDGHDEIVFIPKRREKCPLCVANEEIESLNEQLEGMHEEIEKLEKKDLD